MEGDFMPADFDDHHRRYSSPRRGRLAGGGEIMKRYSTDGEKYQL